MQVRWPCFWWLLLCYIACARAVGGVSKEPSFPFAADRQPSEGDGYGGSGFTVMPVLRNEQPATVIILHGMGATGEAWGFLSLALSFFSLNYVKFIIPTAPLANVTYLDRRLTSWYDIRTFQQSAAADLASLSPQQLLNIVDIDRAQFESSHQRVLSIIDGEVQRGVSPRRIFLIGFSQGGALALHTFLRSTKPLAGAIGVATWVPFIQEYPSAMSAATRNRPMLLMHGTEDTAVPYVFAEYLARRIDTFRDKLNFTTFPGEPHVMLNVHVVDAIERFVEQHAPGTVRYLHTLVKDLTENFGSLTSQFESVPSI
ncbi:unnamed protein product [Agarophyton chilense]